jgi:REP element-mobilizing transposase RayT
MEEIHAPPSEQRPKRRRSLRLKDYDYRQEGAYFITICTHKRKCLLAKVIDNEVHLNDWGRLVESEWLQTARLRPYVSLDAYVVMPNHFHAVLFLHHQERATQRVAPTEETPPGPKAASVRAIVGQFKSQVTKRLTSIAGNIKEPVWQRNYYEHVIRDEDDLNRIRQYTEDNPAGWLKDEYYAP